MQFEKLEGKLVEDKKGSDFFYHGKIFALAKFFSYLTD